MRQLHLNQIGGIKFIFPNDKVHTISLLTKGSTRQSNRYTDSKASQLLLCYQWKSKQLINNYLDIDPDFISF